MIHHKGINNGQWKLVETKCKIISKQVIFKIKEFGSYVATCVKENIYAFKIQHVVFSTGYVSKEKNNSHRIMCICFNCNESRVKTLIKSTENESNS